MGLPDLLTRVEAATVGDNQLSAEIAAHFRLLSPLAEKQRWAREWDGPFVAQSGRVYLAHADGSTGMHFAPLPYTNSIDAAVALIERVLPGASWRAEKLSLLKTKPFWASAGMPGAQEDAYANSAPLALVSALLRAKIATGEGGGE